MSTKRNWLIGCGSGCLIVVVTVIIGGTLVWRTGQKVVAALDEVGESQLVLTGRYGGLRDFEPPADGRIGADRIETFLRVQADTRAIAIELAGHAERLRVLEEGRSLGPGNMIAGIRSVSGLGRSLAAFMDARNASLLDHGMGFGEYSYLWTIAYYADTERPFYPTFSVYDENDSDRRPVRLRDHFKAWLENQTAAAVGRGLDPEWVETLEDESRRIARSELSVPWENGLPQTTAESLAPFRDRLEAAYVELGAMLCVGADKADEGFDFEIQ